MKTAILLGLATVMAVCIGVEVDGASFAAIALFNRKGRDGGYDGPEPDFSLLENVPRPYFLTDAFGVILEHNDAALALANSMGTRISRGTKIRSVFGGQTNADALIYKSLRRASSDGASADTIELTHLSAVCEAEVEIARQANPRYYLWSIKIHEAAVEDIVEPQIPTDIENAPIGYFSATRDGKITEINAHMRKLAGLPDDIADSDLPKVADLFGPDARKLSPNIVSAEEKVEVTLQLNHANGEQVPVRVMQRILTEDAFEGVTQAFVTRLPRQGFQASSDDAKRLVRLLDDAPVALAVTDADGLVLEANDRLATMSGGAARVGAEIALAVRLDDRPDVVERLRNVAAGAAPDSPLDIKLTGEAGKEHEAQFHAHKIDTEAGELLLAYVMDVSAEKVIERQLAQADKMQSVGKLAGGIAHDVNNVLTAIRGHCDLLMLRHHEGDPDFDHLNQIRGQTERAATVISQLLAFSRRQTLRRQVTQLAETLDEMRLMLNPLITERITFRSRHARDLGYVRIDRSEFQRVIMNLAVNACDAMESGGSLLVTTKNIDPAQASEYKHEPLPPAHYVLVEVADTGGGISASDMESIFEPFFTTKGTGKGTGLGLSTVYGIIKQMEGFIFCESEVGKGTVFRVFLPRYFGALDVDQTPELEKREIPRDLSGTGHVLLVEDEDSVRSFAVRALQLRGYQVTAASGGGEAVEIVKEDPEAIDLIVSDVVMPEMTGPEMMREVKKIRPNMGFIFISGYAEDAFREEMMDDEEFHFLAKPFSLKDLAIKVKQAFQAED